MMKKLLTILLALLLVFTCAACAPAREPEPQPEEDVTVRIAGMTGPTSIGLAKLFTDAGSETAQTGNTYDCHMYTNDAEISPLLLNGSLDVAALPSNVAAGLYKSSNGAIRVLAINTLGVVSILESVEGTVKQLTDLRGKTLHAAGSGAVPEYTLRYLLAEAGVGINAAGESDPEKVTVLWEPAPAVQTALSDGVTAGEPVIGMLPQPAATVAGTKGARVALDLNAVWQGLENGSEWITGVLVARADFINRHPGQVATLLRDYRASIAYAQNPENLDAVAGMATTLKITPAVPVAKKAIPLCHLTYVDGTEMKDLLSAFLNLLYTTDPASVNGSLPDSAFYYVAPADATAD